LCSNWEMKTRCSWNIETAWEIQISFLFIIKWWEMVSESATVVKWWEMVSESATPPYDLFLAVCVLFHYTWWADIGQVAYSVYLLCITSSLPHTQRARYKRTSQWFKEFTNTCMNSKIYSINFLKQFTNVLNFCLERISRVSSLFLGGGNIQRFGHMLCFAVYYDAKTLFPAKCLYSTSIESV